MSLAEAPQLSRVSTALSINCFVKYSLNRETTSAKRRPFAVRAPFQCFTPEPAVFFRPDILDADRVKKMPQFLLLGQEIFSVVLSRLRHDRHALHDPQAVAFEPHDLFRVIGQKTDLLDPQVRQD